MQTRTFDFKEQSMFELIMGVLLVGLVELTGKGIVGGCGNGGSCTISPSSLNDGAVSEPDPVGTPPNFCPSPQGSDCDCNTTGNTTNVPTPN
jgi:hypothetical protein